MSNPIPYGDAPVAARITSPGRAIVAAQVSVAQAEFPATVQVGDVTALDPDQNPTVANSGTSESAILDFGIPKAWNIVANSTTTLEPDQSATVTRSEQGGNILLDFGIPKGEKGDTGDTGADATAIYGDPVTVAHGGTGRSNGNGVMWYGQATISTTDNVVTMSATIDGYVHSIGNVFALWIYGNVPANSRIASLTIYSGEDDQVGTTYELSGVNYTSADVAIPMQPSATFRPAMMFVVIDETKARGIQSPMYPNAPIPSKNMVKTHSSIYDFYSMKLAHTTKNGLQAYSLPNMVLNPVSNLYDNIDGIMVKSSDIVIRHGGLWLRFRNMVAGQRNATLPQTATKIQNLFRNRMYSNRMADSVRCAGSISYTIAATGDTANSTFDIGMNETASFGSAVTLKLNAPYPPSVDSMSVQLNDPDGEFQNVTYDIVWCYPITDFDSAALTTMELSTAGITLAAEGSRVTAIIEGLALNLDSTTPSTSITLVSAHGANHYAGFRPSELGQKCTALGLTSDGVWVRLSLDSAHIIITLADSTQSTSGTLDAQLTWFTDND